jgi:hypothetical protein
MVNGAPGGVIGSPLEEPVVAYTDEAGIEVGYDEISEPSGVSELSKEYSGTG